MTEAKEQADQMAGYKSAKSNIEKTLSLDELLAAGAADDRGFLLRHIGPRPSEIKAMLAELGLKSLEELAAKIVPADIRSSKLLDLDDPLREDEVMAVLAELAGRNEVFRSYIGQGFYDTVTPPVIDRSILQNPGWYTQYTPYQAEISQGRLEALLNF
jgi:glycine dehydrogenase